MREVDPPSILIQEATPEDAAGIVDVQYKTWLSTYPKVAPEFVDEEVVHVKFNSLEEKVNKTRERIRKNDPNILHQLVAKAGDEVIGFVISKRYEGKASELLALYVLDEYQGQGVGGQLIEDSLHWLDADKNWVKLHVVEGNTSSISFYEKHGFSFSKKLPLLENPPDGVLMPEIEMVRPPSPIE